MRFLHRLFFGLALFLGPALAFAQPSAPPAITALKQAAQSGVLITGFGDSITGGQSQYFPSDLDISAIPAWTTATVYPAGRVVKNGTDLFYTVAGGTSGATAPVVGALNDGGVTWVYHKPGAYKTSTSYLTWAEVFAGGRLVWDMSNAYKGTQFGAFDVVLSSGGSNYSANPTVTLDNGGTATATVVGGVITKINILSPGFQSGPVNVTITDGTGSGAVVCSAKTFPSGTFGITGENTNNMLCRLNDVLSSPANIVVVVAGVNDVKSVGITADMTISNLRTIYDSIQLAGKRLVVVPIMPFTTAYTTAVGAKSLRVNRFIEGYARGDSWANTSGLRNVRLADPRPYWTDNSTLTSMRPIGGSGGVAGAITADGLHPSPLGGIYLGYVISQAVQPWIGPAQDSIVPYTNAVDGYDPVYNPGGNMLTGLPWQASTAYSLGAQSNNNSTSLYVVTTPGTSAASGGPVGNSGSIVDGTVTWAAAKIPGLSNFSGGTTGTENAAAGVTISGSLASGWTATRTTGTAVGTETFSIESPWSNNRPGKRQVVAWSLGSGGTNEVWKLVTSNYTQDKYGITAADLGVSKLQMEVELEVSGVANVTGIQAFLIGDRFESSVGGVLQGAGAHYLNSTGEQISWPNSGKMLLRTQPMVIPANNTTMQLQIVTTFDASGGANSATLTMKVNSVVLRKVGVPRHRTVRPGLRQARRPARQQRRGAMPKRTASAVPKRASGNSAL